MLGKTFNRRNIEIFFSFSPRKQVFDIHANWDNLQEMSNPALWGKKKEHYTKLSLLS